MIPIIEALEAATPATGGGPTPPAEAGDASGETFEALIALLVGGSPPTRAEEPGPDRSSEAPSPTAEGDGVEPMPQPPAFADPPTIGPPVRAVRAPQPAVSEAAPPARPLPLSTEPPPAALTQSQSAATEPALDLATPESASDASANAVGSSEDGPNAEDPAETAPDARLPRTEDAPRGTARRSSSAPGSQAAERALDVRVAHGLQRSEPVPPAAPRPDQARAGEVDQLAPAARRPEHARASEVESATARLRPELATAVARQVDGAAPAAVAQESLEARGPELAARLADTVELAATRGPRELRIQLRPPELGQLTVRVVETDAGLRVAIEASRGEVEELLQRQLPALQTALEARDLRVDRLEVRPADLSEAGLPERDESRGDGDREADEQLSADRDFVAGDDASEVASGSDAATAGSNQRVDVRI